MAPPVASVSASPALGSTDLSPSAPITVSVRNGTITTFTLTNPAGKVVAGALSADKTRWTLGEDLGYGKIYTAAGTAVGTDGRTVPISGTFGMLGTGVQANSNISPGDGQTVGVAEPIIIRFPTNPVDRKAVEQALTVTTTPQVQGAWAWIHHDDAWGIDWRPKNYWPAGTKVHVSAKLYGLKLADKMFGAQDLTTDFTIGRSQVVYADATTHQIVVEQGCAGPDAQSSCTSTVATYPASFGGGDTTGGATSDNSETVTRTGVHVVLEKEPNPYVMHGTAPFNYTSTEYWAVRISDNGEFIHQNQNTVAQQGHNNVSHGCINLSAANAQSYYGTALIGDPVEVTNTSVTLGPTDGDLFDWTIPWAEWQSLSAS